MQENRKGSVMGAVSDSQGPANAPQSPAPKKDFQDPFKQQADDLTSRRRQADERVKRSVESKTEGMIESANAAISGQGSQADLNEFDELEKISEQDLELAQQLIFKGYAEKDIVNPNMPDHKFTIATTSAEDVSVVDEIIYDMIRQSEGKDGEPNLPAQHVQTMRSALLLAFGFKGVDGKDFCDEAINQLLTIKRAVIKVKDLEYEGDMEQSKKLMESLKRAAKHRAVRMRRLPTPVIDFLSQRKFEFDTTMYQIMMSDKIIPKYSGQSQGRQELTSSMREEGSSTDQ